MDLELLRTFVAIVETGGFAKAGARRHMTQSTVSMQMKRLAEQAGHPLFIARGRSRSVTPAAELLFSYAQRLLALHDETLHALGAGTQRELVRIGSTQDFAEGQLPSVLRAFHQSHPQVQLQVRVGWGQELSRLVTEGALDVAVVFESQHIQLATPFARERGAWLSAPNFEPPQAGEAWPLALFDAPCAFRDAALRALDEAGLAWRIVYSTPSLSGLLAAVRAGLAITLRLKRHSQKGLSSLGSKQGLPTAPRFRLGLVTRDSLSPGVRALTKLLRAEAMKRR
jgi:DNA-binding transcriptional LysR family regulator